MSEAIRSFGEAELTFNGLEGPSSVYDWTSMPEMDDDDELQGPKRVCSVRARATRSGLELAGGSE